MFTQIYRLMYLSNSFSIAKKFASMSIFLLLLSACQTAGTNQEEGTTAETSQEEVATEEASAPVDSTETTATTDPATELDAELAARLADLESYSATCGGAETDLAIPVMEIAKNLEAQKLAYIREKMQDCSGMYHQVLMKLKDRCPDHAYPDVDKYRDSRSLAKWYHENEKLILVKDEKSKSDLIKPGAAMFYGYQGKDYSNFTAEDLFVRGTGINHVGIVVDVKKDENGQVTNYSIFHGRNPKHTAGITSYHNLVPTRESYPPLGNGGDKWVAIAPAIWN